MFTLALEWPIPYFRKISLGRSLVFRVVWYFLCGFLARTSSLSFPWSCLCRTRTEVGEGLERRRRADNFLRSFTVSDFRRWCVLSHHLRRLLPSNQASTHSSSSPSLLLTSPQPNWTLDQTLSRTERELMRRRRNAGKAR